MNLDIGLMLKFTMGVGVVIAVAAWIIYFWFKRQQRLGGFQAKSTHITHVGGNVFADLGFEPGEAAALKAESQHVISEELEAGGRGIRIKYDEQEDILHIEFSQGAIVRDVSCSWDVHLGYTEGGIAEITILDAKKNGYWPLGCIG